MKRIFLEKEKSKVLFWAISLPSDDPSSKPAEDVIGYIVWLVGDANWEVIRE